MSKAVEIWRCERRTSQTMKQHILFWIFLIYCHPSWSRTACGSRIKTCWVLRICRNTIKFCTTNGTRREIRPNGSGLRILRNSMLPFREIWLSSATLQSSNNMWRGNCWKWSSNSRAKSRLILKVARRLLNIFTTETVLFKKYARTKIRTSCT